MKGGSQEVASVVASLNQPDFDVIFKDWLHTVHRYPRAFDLKYESIVSILDFNPQVLFGYLGERERQICSDYTKKLCKFGFTIEEFQDSWEKKLKALKFATTLYLKEPNGLTQTKFYLKKGDSECRFNILNYLSPFWREVSSGDQEFHITLDLKVDEPKWNEPNQFYFKSNDEIIFMKRDDFWLAKRKGDIYTYQSARLVNDPFKITDNQTHFINIFGLILEYNEKDATVVVADLPNILGEYSRLSNCKFELTQSTSKKQKTRSPSITYINHSQTNEEVARCKILHRNLKMTSKNMKNIYPFWSNMANKVIGVVDYVDPIQAVMRTWDLKFAVLPCELRWSNNLMMVLPKREDEGKCLRFIAATEGELFVVIATTPSDQNSWYMFQITTKGVVFYRVICF